MKNNPDLLQVAEVKNSDTDVSADASKTNEENWDMNISKKEEHTTVGYQETLKIDVENINKNINTIWRPIYEVMDETFFGKMAYFHDIFILV